MMDLFEDSFKLFGILFFLIFLLVIGVFVTVLVCILKRWSKNNRSPRLTVGAVIIAKRTQMSHYHRNDDMMSTTHTTYYMTFQVQSGDRMELQVDSTDYGLLIEGDRGFLTFQGTRYLDFQRQY